MNETAAVRVSSMKRFEPQGRWRAEALHSHRDHCLLWFSKGQGRILIDGVPRMFGSNTVIYLPAGTQYAFELKPGVFGSQTLIAPHPTLDLPDHPILHRLRDILGQAEFVGHFEAMQREVAREDAAGKDKACRLHANLIGVWLERQENHLARSSRKTASQKLSRRYAKLVEQRYATGPSIADMAGELGVTPTHLTRACKEAAGASAHQILNDRVMYEARALLSSTRTPVGRIAKDLGFSSAAYFTRAFQKSTGQTPSAFRSPR